MNYTDPSGYLFFGPAKSLLRKIAKIPILNTLITIGLNFIPHCTAWCSAVYAGASTYAVTGSLRQGIKVGLVSYVANQAHANPSNNFFTAGLIGGLASKALGGNFGHGFGAAAAGNLFAGKIDVGNPYANVLISAVIGGTVSKLTGGKFSNGAQSWAFQSAVVQGWPFDNSVASSKQAQSEANTPDSNKPRTQESTKKKVANNLTIDEELIKPPVTRGYAMLLAAIDIFGPEVAEVMWTIGGRAELFNVLATTDKNRVWVYVTDKTCGGCNSYNSFFNDASRNLDFTVLEEYYHVINQWNTGQMTKSSYLWQNVVHGGYENNPYEIQAKEFAKNNLNRFRTLINQYQGK